MTIDPVPNFSWNQDTEVKGTPKIIIEKEQTAYLHKLKESLEKSNIKSAGNRPAYNYSYEIILRRWDANSLGQNTQITMSGDGLGNIQNSVRAAVDIITNV